MNRAPFYLAPFLGALLGVILCTPPAAAQFPPEIISQAAVVMDASTGTVVYEKNPHDAIPPASLTKLMTMHLVLSEIAAGRASPEEIISLPRESWAVNQEPGSSLMRLAGGQSVSLRELLLGMAVVSGNDAAVAAALRFTPTVADFVEMMNREAAALGLSNTRFVDTSGYWEHNMTTAREFTEFCRIYLEAHPQSLEQYHSVREFAFPRTENGAAVRRNSNTLLGRVEGVDGLKTGYIPESGYNIALTAERSGTRFIAVILGAPSEWGGDRIRDDDGTRLINWAFSNFRTIRLDPPVPEPVRIWKGKENFIELTWGAPLQFTALAERGEDMQWNIEMEDPLIAPLPAGTWVGNLNVYDSLGGLRIIPLLTAREAEQGGFFKRLFDSIRLLFRRK